MNFNIKVQGIRALYMIYVEIYYSSKGYIPAQMEELSTSISLPVYRYLKASQSQMGSVVSDSDVSQIVLHEAISGFSGNSDLARDKFSCDM